MARALRAFGSGSLNMACAARARAGNIDRAIGVASFRVEIWNARRGAGGEDDEMSSAAREKLINHFRQDGEALAEMLGTKIPWLATWAGP